ESWTQVVVTWAGLTGSAGSASLFVNGKPVPPARTIAESFALEPQQLAIRLGVNYTGLLDDIAVFNRVLSEKEIAALYTLSQ
ncbi:MAG: LamG-like jellyroll fold domain-containing protein, partial [Bryobacteraceae bacterium]